MLFSIPPRQIHDVAQLVATQITCQVVQEELGLALLEVRRAPTVMGRDHHVWQIPQRRVRRQGFLIEDVQRRTPDLPLSQGLDERFVIDNGAAGDIDQPSVGSHPA